MPAPAVPRSRLPALARAAALRPRRSCGPAASAWARAVTSLGPVNELRRIAVYCGAREGADPAYRQAAGAMGRALAARRIGLVYGGGALGLMGAIADAALAAGGEVIGVIPAFMDGRETIHRGLTQLRVSRSMHDRKATMLDLADGVIALPGGLGTLDELIEAMTWAQLGLHQIPCGLLDVDGFWQPFVDVLEHCIARGFLEPARREAFVRSPDPAGLLDALGHAPPPPRRTRPRR
jgi:uncharacterized protein (TIGR00730 family)